MRILDHEQRSDEWYAARLGVPTASSFSRLITPTGKPAAGGDSYIDELIAEKITGKAIEIPVTYAMTRGITIEPEARKNYEFIHDCTVYEVGLCLHDELEAGASPDGLIGEDGLLEIKCPLAHTHIGYLREGRLPPKYNAQVQGQLWITGRQWCDFMSYHPDMKIFIVRVKRNEKFIATLEELVANACSTIKKFSLELLAQ